MNESHPNNTAAELKYRLKEHPLATRIIFAVLVLILVLLILWGTVSLVLVFFSVENIEVYGESPYSSEELILSSGIEKGDRLYYLGADKKEAELLEKYPYLKSVEIKSYFPNKAVIEIESFEAVYVSKHESGYSFLNEDFKILEIIEPKASFDEIGAIYLDLPYALSGETGSRAVFEDEGSVKDICALLKSFEYFDKINKISVKDKHNFSFVFAENCKIILGNMQNTEEKLRLAIKIYDSADFNRESLSIIDVSNEKKVILRYVSEEDFEK